jgi:hypothetical protein
MKTRMVAAFVASLAVALASAAPAPLQAQAPAPKPPTDARRTVQPAKRGSLAFEPNEIAYEVAASQARDFDATATFVNPALPIYFVGMDFRAVTYSRFYMLIISSLGEALLLVSRSADDIAAVKEPVFVPNWRKNTGESNDVALYVRGTQALLFVNRAYVDAWDVSEINDFGALRLFGAGPEDAAGQIAYRNFTVRVPNNAVPPAAPTKTNAGIVVEMYRSGYAQWGRPAGMNDPRQGCQPFDDSQPVWQFQAALKVTNNTQYPMKRWLPLAVKRDGQPAFGCIYSYQSMPEIAPGASVDITVDWYIEKSEAIAYLIVVDLDLGRSSRVPTPAP